MDGPIGMVLSGGGARGAYEFGALEVLAPVLNEPARIIVGTSAGALGAAYVAANAHEGLEAAARSGARKWREVEIGDVIGPLCSPRELARVLLYALEVLGIRAPGPPSLLDTSPQPKTIAALIDFEQFSRNVQDGTLATAAVVATAYATARSVVFHDGGQSPPADDRRGIDYVATRLAVEHVQASGAIQSLFPAVRVGEHWCGDGGVRLNTPLKPALKLNADRLVVIGLNSVAGPPLEYDDRRPDVFDGAAAVAQSLLADQLAHDVDTLATINDDVKESDNPITHRLVPYIFVAPTDRLAIGRLATDVYNRHYAGAHGLYHNRDLALLGRLLDAGSNPIRGELLSYLFFASEFVEPLIELGRRDAQAWLDDQGTRGRGAPSTRRRHRHGRRQLPDVVSCSIGMQAGVTAVKRSARHRRRDLRRPEAPLDREVPTGVPPRCTAYMRPEGQLSAPSWRRRAASRARPPCLEPSCWPR